MTAEGNRTAGGGAHWPFDFGAGRPAAGFRIRSITAGAPLEDLDDLATLDAAADVLETAKSRFEALGYEVQTLRIATPAAWTLGNGRARSGSVSALAALERHAGERAVLLGIGPLAALGAGRAETTAFARDLARATDHLCFSLPVAEPDTAPDPVNIAIAGEIAAALAQDSPGGEAAFRFAAAACCPAGTPFFPAAWHEGDAAVSIGIEAPFLVADAIEAAEGDLAAVPAAVANRLEDALAPLEPLALGIAREQGWRFLGIDTSPAPMLAASIAGPLERLAGAPFGAPGTLAACAAVTAGLKRASVPACGFSGLMLPLLEDAVLAARASEGHFGIADLLSCSAVCGTGLDTVPVPGDSSPETLAAVIGDMAALSAAYAKPLVARLLPVPGKAAGDAVRFDTPFLMDSRVLPLAGRLTPPR